MYLIALFVVLPVIWLLLTNWQLALVGLGTLLFVRIAAAKFDGGRVAGRELPAPGYLPRWTWRRRLEAGRELAQWQERFDA